MVRTEAKLTIIFGSVVPDSLRPVYELLRQWCGHRSVTFYERRTGAEAEVRRLEILIARLIHTVRERPFDIGGQERGNAHWCTIGVSVIFSKGLLVHHPVCR